MSKMGEEARMAYLQQQVEGASKEELLIMLLDGAMRFTSNAYKAYDEEKWDEFHNNLVRVQDIFMELMLSLDGGLGETAIQLVNIYGFINEKLIQANIDHDRQYLDQAKGLIVDVRTMWLNVIEKAKGEDGFVAHRKPEDAAPKSINVRG